MNGHAEEFFPSELGLDTLLLIMRIGWLGLCAPKGRVYRSIMFPRQERPGTPIIDDDADDCKHRSKVAGLKKQIDQQLDDTACE